jgi:hypothetical protein
MTIKQDIELAALALNTSGKPDAPIRVKCCRETIAKELRNGSRGFWTAADGAIFYDTHPLVMVAQPRRTALQEQAAAVAKQAAIGA